MKYARRSVSEQDLRRYDMFAQVSVAYAFYDVRVISDHLSIESSTKPRIWIIQVPRRTGRFRRRKCTLSSQSRFPGD